MKKKKLSYGKQFINKDDINEVIKCLTNKECKSSIFNLQ